MAFKRTYLTDFALANPIYAGATVTLYGVLAGVKDTTNLVTVYDAATGAGTLTNPQKLDSDGKWLQDVYVDEPVVMSITGVRVADHDTGIVNPDLDGSDIVNAEFRAAATAGYAAIANDAAADAERSAIAAAAAIANDELQIALIAQSFG